MPDDLKSLSDEALAEKLTVYQLPGYEPLRDYMAEAARRLTRMCRWMDSRAGRRWDTSCGTTSNVLSIHFEFCPYCGGRLESREETPDEQ